MLEKTVSVNSTMCLLPCAIADIAAQVADSQELTVADRYGLMAGILNGAFTEEEQAAVDRILRAVRRGRVQVVDQLSAVL